MSATRWLGARNGVAATGRSYSRGGSGHVARIRDWHRDPFRTLVVMGESTVEGGPWLPRMEDRWADVLARLINHCQGEPVAYHNRGIGANAISPRSPGYEASAKPSALERYQRDVIELRPDLFVLAYGLNDMRAGMPVDDFRGDMAKIIRDVKAACDPVVVLATVYHMTAWRSFPPFDRGSPDLTRVYNEGIRRLAAEHDCLVADVWEGQGEADWLLHPDGVHATVVGNLIIAHRVFETIANHCSGLSERAHRQAEGTEWTTSCTGSRAGVGDPFDPWWSR